MPYASIEKRRKAAREGMAKARLKRRKVSTVAKLPEWPSDPGQAVADWAAAKLVVPPGHKDAGHPLFLPPFAVDFLRDAYRHRESALLIARKNAKSATIAVLVLAHLAEGAPLVRLGWRAGVCSVTANKAAELKMQMQAIAEASNLRGLRFLRTPAPGRVESPYGLCDILSADKSAGHASGFDVSIVDEIGLLSERDRDLINGMRSATSARDGRFISLSIMGDAPFTREILNRKGQPGIAVHHFAAPEDCEIDDVDAWYAANPGLGGIKSLEHMRDAARRVLATPADQAAFRALELNNPQAPSREMICSVADWNRCVVTPDELPPRTGHCVVGFDAGGSASMTAAVALWDNGRLECWGAFPTKPDLKLRAAADGLPYLRMQERGELEVYAGRVTPRGEFLRDVAHRLAGQRVLALGGDRYRKEDILETVETCKLGWPLVWRGQGKSATADGSHDVRAFEKLVLTGELRTTESLLMASAIASSSVVRDDLGNPALKRVGGRIDALSAAVIAAGLLEKHRGRKPRRLQWAAV